MIRCTIEIIPYGIEKLTQKIGMIEIANDNTGNINIGNYKVLLKKMRPFKGALKENWKKGNFIDKEFILTDIVGFNRKKRGVYDLLYLALRACGIHKRNE